MDSSPAFQPSSNPKDQQGHFNVLPPSLESLSRELRVANTVRPQSMRLAVSNNGANLGGVPHCPSVDEVLRHRLPSLPQAFEHEAGEQTSFAFVC